MKDWLKNLKYDPITPLLSCSNPAITYFTKRDLLNTTTVPVETLWELPGAQRIIRRQQPDGRWRYPGGNHDIRSADNYDQLETYRQYGELVEKYGLNSKHTSMPRATEFLFRFQTSEGDFRGIYGNQYTPNYSAGIFELMIKAGYGDDRRVEKGMKWLLSIRQADGGWTIPIRTLSRKLDVIALEMETLEPDRSKPLSWLATGVVLRAFAVHPHWRHSIEARNAGGLLAGLLFRKDNYPDRGTPDYWLRFSFPFWFTDLLSALDSLTRLDLGREEPGIKEGLDWLVQHQSADGLWDVKMLRIKDRDMRFWLGLLICRVLKRFYSNDG